MRTLYIHPDTGCRKGCHPVSILRVEKRGPRLERYFSIDEPGYWFEDMWNCHVDGCDYPCKTKEQAIQWGAYILRSNKEDPGIEIIETEEGFYV